MELLKLMKKSIKTTRAAEKAQVKEIRQLLEIRTEPVSMAYVPKHRSLNKLVFDTHHYLIDRWFTWDSVSQCTEYEIIELLPLYYRQVFKRVDDILHVFVPPGMDYNQNALNEISTDIDSLTATVLSIDWVRRASDHDPDYVSHIQPRTDEDDIL